MIATDQSFDNEFEVIFLRIQKLKPDSSAHWGEMNVAQMLAHCAEIQEVFNGKALANTPWFVKLMGGLIRKTVFSSKPYQRSIRTHAQYIVSDEREFATERQRLLNALSDLKNGVPHPDQSQHPLFGEMSQPEKMAGSFKHLDHHLQQFGV